MCGIVGYVGKSNATPILLDGLSKLEYRGYDSAGLAVGKETASGRSEQIQLVKSVGRLSRLQEEVTKRGGLEGRIGIGHTRWATHGAASLRNAHPHASEDGLVVGVHNGIIENFRELRKDLEAKGLHFQSETDTEVIIQWMSERYKKDHDPLQTLLAMSQIVRGSYAMALLFTDRPGEIWVTRKDSPLILGREADASYVASDVPALLAYTRNVYYINDREIACVKAGEITVYSEEGRALRPTYRHIDWDAQAAEKGGYAHFMAKEMDEQPRAVQETLAAYLSMDPGASGKQTGPIHFDEALPDKLLQSAKRLRIVACGSAYHAGLVGRDLVETLAKIPTSCEIASEFRYRAPLFAPGDLVVIISQSGETADSLAALRLAKEAGVPTLAVVNVRGASIAREADHVLYTYAGPEIAVATTKGYSTQLIMMELLALHLAEVQGRLEAEEADRLKAALIALPDQMKKVLQMGPSLHALAQRLARTHDIFFIGRGMDYAMSVEASLKLKEISYIHSEAYAAGELKHGTISLIEAGTPVIGLLTQPGLYEKTRSNLVEVKSRGAYVIGVSYEDRTDLDQIADEMIRIPRLPALFVANVLIIPLQLLAYQVALEKGLDVDKPRNLAKSVTVE